MRIVSTRDDLKFYYHGSIVEPHTDQLHDGHSDAEVNLPKSNDDFVKTTHLLSASRWVDLSEAQQSSVERAIHAKNANGANDLM